MSGSDFFFFALTITWQCAHIFKVYSIGYVVCFPEALQQRQHNHQRSTFIYSINIHLSFLGRFFMNRAVIGARGWGGGRLEILWKSKTKGLLCSNEACPSRDRAWARLNLSHNREPTMKQTLPWCSDYCAGARHSCGESHLGVGGNKCFFNWNTGISSCFLHVFYESPVPIVWNFALTSPRRPGLIERVSVWNRFKRNLCLSVMRVCLFQGRVWLRV